MFSEARRKSTTKGEMCQHSPLKCCPASWLKPFQLVSLGLPWLVALLYGSFYVKAKKGCSGGGHPFATHK